MILKLSLYEIQLPNSGTNTSNQELDYYMSNLEQRRGKGNIKGQEDSLQKMSAD